MGTETAPARLACYPGTHNVVMVGGANGTLLGDT